MPYCNDLNVDQGATYKETIIYEDENNVAIDMTGYTAKLDVRTGYLSEAPIAEFSLTELSGIDMSDASNGVIEFTFTDTQTAGLDASVTYRYDLEITSPTGDVTRLVQGRVEVNPQVTD